MSHPGPPPSRREYYGRGDSGPRGDWRRDRPHPYRRPSPRPLHGRGGGGYHRGPPRGGGGGRRRPSNNIITFRSFEEEQAWLEERRRRRKDRPSKFDVLPSLDQQQQQPDLAAAAATTSSLNAALTSMTPHYSQQTRHARRLYVGNLPPMIIEAELQDIFTSAIQHALVVDDDSSQQARDQNPILNVYINHERHFCFIEFTTVEMTTACMAMDGLMIQGMAVKVKRPNDYNPMTAPKVHPAALPVLDVSRLGIISRTVPDGPNKIFIGGLHYHLQEPQVLELLQAFGKVKAFHLVKNESDGGNSKGYCFVEYADPAVTPIAVQGLNGMDIGGGKTLTARLAGERSAMDNPITDTTPVVMQEVIPQGGVPPLDRTIVAGYDIEELVDAAMGLIPVPPMVPKYRGALGEPLTRIVPLQHQQQQQQQVAPMIPTTASTMTPASTSLTTAPTRVLVLHNMVSDQDLATDKDYFSLMAEVQEECQKYGNLQSLSIPREGPARYKIFLEYTTVEDALAAERELKGRKFGDNIVDTSYYNEDMFAAGELF